MAVSSCVEAETLESTNKEADTRIVLHSKDAVTSGYQRIIINCRYTDDLVLMIHFCDSVAADELWMSCGTKLKPKYIPVHTVHRHLDDSICDTLSGFQYSDRV